MIDVFQEEEGRKSFTGKSDQQTTDKEETYNGVVECVRMGTWVA